MKKMVFILMAAVWLTFTGCGGSGIDKGEGEAAKTTDRGAYAVRIVPEKTLFTETDRSAGCEVVLTDEKGNTVHRKVTWRSSHPDVVDVDADGNFHVKGQVGSSQIVVTTEDSVSRSIIVLVTRPAPGVVLVDDGDVEGAVVLTDVNATYGVGTRYMFRWKHAAVPSPGTLMLGTGTQPIAGKVIDAKASGGVVEVELEVVPVDELFEALEMDERVDSETMEPIWNESVVRDYEIEREDEAFRLRPKEVGRVLEPKYGTSVNRRSFGFGGSNFGYKFALGIFECEASAATTPVRVSVPQFSISHPMRVDVAFSLQNHDFKFVLHNDYEARLDLDLDVVASWTGGLECTKDLVTFPIPVTGAASWFFGFYVPLGIGFGMSGELEVANLKYHLQSRASVKMEAGIDCESGQCENVTDVDGNDSEVTGRWDVPTGDFSQNFRLKPKVEGFGYAKMQMGIDPRIVHMAPGLQTARILQLDLVQISGGLSGEGDFATRRGQLFNDDYASEYGLYSFFTWKTGNSVDNLLSSLLHVRNGSLSLEKKYELAKSPRVRSFTADRYAYDALTTVTFEIELDPDTVELGWLGYNIDKLNVYRRVELPDGSESIEKIFTIEPAGEETSFRHEWLALDEGVTEDNIFVMVESKYVPPFGEFGELELASCHVNETYGRKVVCSNGVSHEWVFDNGERLKEYTVVRNGVEEKYTYTYEDINGSPLHYYRKIFRNGSQFGIEEFDESIPVRKEPYFDSLMIHDMSVKKNLFMEKLVDGTNNGSYMFYGLYIPLHQNPLYTVDPETHVLGKPVSLRLKPYLLKRDIAEQGISERIEYGGSTVGYYMNWNDGSFILNVNYDTNDNPVYAEITTRDSVTLQGFHNYRYGSEGRLLSVASSWNGISSELFTEIEYDATRIAKIENSLYQDGKRAFKETAKYHYNVYGDIAQIKYTYESVGGVVVERTKEYTNEYDYQNRLIHRTSRLSDDYTINRLENRCEEEEWYTYVSTTGQVRKWRIINRGVDTSKDTCGPHDAPVIDLTCEIFDDRW